MCFAVAVLIRGARWANAPNARSRAENSATLEDSRGATPAHFDGVAARERNDTAGDCGSDGCFAEYREPGAYGLRPGWHQSARAEAMRRTQAREHDDSEGESVAGALCQSRRRR